MKDFQSLGTQHQSAKNTAGFSRRAAPSSEFPRKILPVMLSAAAISMAPIVGSSVPFSLFQGFGAATAESSSASEDDAKGKDDKSKDDTASKDNSDAIPVGVVAATTRDISKRETFSGRIEAINSVDLIAKVTGYLKEKHFEEGTQVKAGDLLFQLEDDVYSNALTQARAALQIAEAQETFARQNYSRQSALTDRAVASVATLDQARASLGVSTAQVAGARAQVDAAQLNLNYTRIYAPLSGKIGRAAVSVGDLISPQSGLMATVVQTDPVYATFPIPQTLLLKIQKAQRDGDDARIQLILADGTIYDQTGTFNYAANQATASTDSVLIRATVPNPDSLLLDRQLVSVQITDKNTNMVLTIPQQALLTDQQGPYVLVVDKENKAARVNIEVGTQRDGLLVVTKGLKEGEQVITSGIQKVSPGTLVKPAPAEDQQ